MRGDLVVYIYIIWIEWSRILFYTERWNVRRCRDAALNLQQTRSHDQPASHSHAWSLILISVIHQNYQVSNNNDYRNADKIHIINWIFRDERFGFDFGFDFGLLFLLFRWCNLVPIIQQRYLWIRRCSVLVWNLLGVVLLFIDDWGCFSWSFLQY